MCLFYFFFLMPAMREMVLSLGLLHIKKTFTPPVCISFTLLVLPGNRSFFFGSLFDSLFFSLTTVMNVCEIGSIKLCQSMEKRNPPKQKALTYPVWCLRIFRFILVSLVWWLDKKPPLPFTKTKHLKPVRILRRVGRDLHLGMGLCEI